MNSIGEIKHKREIEYKGHGYTYFQWTACNDCGEERWVPIKKGKVVFPICNACRNRITAKHNPYLFKKGEHNGVEFKKGQHPSLATEWKKGIGYTGKRYWLKDGAFGKKISDTMKRRGIKPSYRFTAENNGGDKHWNWKGGIYPANLSARSRGDYDKWRIAVFERDSYTCQQCGLKSGMGESVYLHAHHIKTFAEYPDLRFEIDNGVTLCKHCHLEIHGLLPKEVLQSG